MLRTACAIALCLLTPAALLADDWPQWLGPQRDGVWREKAIVKKLPDDLKPLWRTPIGTGYSGPAVVGNRVYVMDRLRAVGKDGKPLRPTRDGVPGKERVLCLDAKTGKQVWKHEYDCPYRMSYGSGPRVTPLVRGGRVYVLGAMGDLKCLDEEDGKPVWEKNLLKAYKLDDPPVWGFAAHPLLVGDLLYTLVGGKGSAVVAFDKDSGKERWKALTTAEIGYSPPMLAKGGGKDQLIVWVSESLNGLDPKTGKVYWTQQYPAGRPPARPSVNIISVVPHGRQLFISSFYHGSMLLELDKGKPEAKVLWRSKSNDPARPDGLHAAMATPVFKDGHIFGTGATGELRCLDAKTGKQKWQTFDLTAGGEEAFCGTTFLIPQGGRFVAFNDVGELMLAELSPKGHKVVSRKKIIEPLEVTRGRTVVWCHPAFANKSVYVRNDKEIICVPLAEGKS